MEKTKPEKHLENQLLLKLNKRNRMDMSHQHVTFFRSHPQSHTEINKQLVTAKVEVERLKIALKLERKKSRQQEVSLLKYTSTTKFLSEELERQMDRNRKLTDDIAYLEAENFKLHNELKLVQWEVKDLKTSQDKFTCSPEEHQEMDIQKDDLEQLRPEQTPEELESQLSTNVQIFSSPLPPKEIKVGIIGGSCFDCSSLLEDSTEKWVDTPYGEPSDTLILGRIDNVECVFLFRHGRQQSIMPSDVNYRANIWALKEEGCTHVLSTTVCGSLQEEIWPGDIILLDQFIDRTTKREQTFFDGQLNSPAGICHIPMAQPFCTMTRKALADVLNELKIWFHRQATVLCMEGPRYSSQAESAMFRQWKAHVINMTSVPEVVLAKEAALCYASIAVAAKYDCFNEQEEGVVCEEREINTLKESIETVKRVLLAAIPQMAQSDWEQTFARNRDLVLSNTMLPKD